MQYVSQIRNDAADGLLWVLKTGPASGMCQILERGMFKWTTSECVQSVPKAWGRRQHGGLCVRMAQRASGDTRRRVKYTSSRVIFSGLGLNGGREVRGEDGSATATRMLPTEVWAHSTRWPAVALKPPVFR